MRGRLRVAACAALAAAGCGDNLPDPFAGLVRVTGASPFPDGCSGVIQPGVDFRGLEVEPWVAVDPADPLHLIGAWQQDRWSNGGANGVVAAASFDGGATWERSFARFSRCSGGNPGNGGDFDRATDPWVSFGPDGTAHLIALAFDASSPRHAILAARSDDGGRSWSAPETLRADDDPDVFNDKETITADPLDGRFVYATWDRLTGLATPTEPVGTGPTWFARATAGVWEPARPIFDPGVDAQTIANQIVVLPDGSLLDVLAVITQASSDAPEAAVAVIRSTDRGDTWSAPVEVARFAPAGVRDPDGVPIRTGAEVPASAVDRATGAVYVVWQDGRFGGGAIEGIAFARSTDLGATWTAPRRVNGDGGAAAFTPAIAVAADGAIGVTYYDLRATDPDAAPVLGVTAWLATSRDGGETWAEEPLTGAFGLGPARIGEVFFLGDYQGLAASGDAFVPFFAAVTAPTDIFVRPL